MNIKDLLLNRGWAGKTISRAETIQRINPLVRQLLDLTWTYQNAVEHMVDGEVADALRLHLKELRMDVGKLCEIVFSCGGVAPTGAGMRSESYPAGDTDDARLAALLALDKAMLAAVEGEKKVEHQMRNRAVLGFVERKTQERMAYLTEELRTR